MPENETKKAFLLFSIGPVQEFIATARRTHDLWAGSRLLSLLMLSALNEATGMGATPIFPLQNKDGQWPKSVSNRAVLEVPSTVDGAEIGREMVAAVKNKWSEIEVEVRQRFTQYAPNKQKDWGKLWEAQNKNWLEQYWITWKQGEDYNVGYKRASDKLDARKLLRPITARVEMGEKCTLSGVMAALPGATVNRRELREFWDGVREQVRVANDVSDTAVRRGEQLCALSVVKRFAEADTVLKDEKRRFPSTSSVAAADFRLALLQNWDQVKGVVLAWMTAVTDLGLPLYKTREPVACLDNAATDQNTRKFLKHDGDYLYPDFYTDARILETLGKDKQGKLDGTSKRRMQNAATALQTLRKKCQELTIALPSPYYALLKMDGDEIGKKLSNKIKSRGKHQEFSRRLADFAQHDVPQIVEEEAPGALVYAGGDDALALLPVSAALPVAEALRTRFAEKLSNDSANGWGALHASAGVVFVHHHAPLQTAVRHATLMEKVAKNEHDRNAIAIKLLRRSGEPHEMGGKWVMGSDAVTAVMDTVQQKMVTKTLATKFAYEVMDEAAALSGLPPAALEVEIGRLLRRHWDEKERIKPSVKKEIDGLTKRLIVVATANKSLEIFGKWLLLVAFLAKRGGDV